MNKKFAIKTCLLLSGIALNTISSSLFAADCSADVKAVTGSDVSIPIEVLAYNVKPLTKCELEVEAQAWLLLLKEKITEISHAEVAAIYKEQEITAAEKKLAQNKSLKKSLEDARNC